jgi:hypothetical protein
MEIKIGADELIMWLRKNKKADNIDNATLGHRIKKLIVSFDGELNEENHPSIWANDLNPVAAERLAIPMTSAQYNIVSSKLPEIFEEISNW